MIKITSYADRVQLVDIEFRFLKLAISSLSASKKQKFFSDFSNERLARLEAGRKILVPDILKPEDFENMKIYAKKRARKEFAPGNRQVYTETIQDGINASELLIRVALFEAFMKDIHAEVLRARPALLGIIRPEQQVKYKHIFTESASFQEILHQQIYREIDEVDRSNFLKKAEYFEKYLKLPMGDEVQLKFVSCMMNVRNEISHENPFKNPFKTVLPDDLKKIVKLFSDIPAVICNKAKLEYGAQHFA